MTIFKWIGGGGLVALIAIAATIGIGSYLTERDIRQFQEQVEGIARSAPGPVATQAAISNLPEPVQRYFDFVFPDGISETRLVRLTSEGQFRRPQTDSFSFTTSEQVIAASTPALMFSATTPIIPGVWARAYDYFANGEMEMKAKVLSTLTVVDERETAELNVTSLRRWLLESSLYPQGLLPGGPVTWEAIDGQTARAIIAADGLRSSMIVRFGETGEITHMVAEEDGELSTPYHGSGEHVTRSDYRDVGGVMIPHSFVISRMAGGEIYPFFNAQLTSIEFE